MRYCLSIKSSHELANGDPNPAEANAAWVYHDGNEAGPFTTEVVTQRLNAGHWPAHAVAGLNDRTTWFTAAEWLEKTKSGTAARN